RRFPGRSTALEGASGDVVRRRRCPRESSIVEEGARLWVFAHAHEVDDWSMGDESSERVENARSALRQDDGICALHGFLDGGAENALNLRQLALEIVPVGAVHGVEAYVWIVNHHVDAVLPQLSDERNDGTLAKIVGAAFERQAKDRDGPHAELVHSDER